MSVSKYFPVFLSAKTAAELQKMIMDVQLKNNGKVSIITIYYDGRNHVCWYYPLTNKPGGVM